MKTYWLTFQLKSDTTLGRGDGVAGLVDMEVQHNKNGLPYLGGKTLKGLLAATCAEVMFALEKSVPTKVSTWKESAQRLFGVPGSGMDESAILHVGDAKLPADLYAAIAYYVEYENLSRRDVLESLTTLRRQTAMDAVSGAPQEESLRTIRVILRETPFEARLDFIKEPTNQDLGLLAACVKAWRRVGTARNRGLGKLEANLYDDDPNNKAILPVTDNYFEHFRQEVQA